MAKEPEQTQAQAAREQQQREQQQRERQEQRQQRRQPQGGEEQGSAQERREEAEQRRRDAEENRGQVDEQRQDKEREQREQRQKQLDARKPAEDYPLGSPQNPMRMVAVPGAVDTEGGGLATITPRQRAGLDPMNAAHDDEQASYRFILPNTQTDHEREKALDPVSRGPSPGITARTPLTGLQTGQALTDMNGRPPMELNEDEQEAFPKIKEALSKARGDDKSAKKSDNDAGFRTPLEMGIPGAIVERVVSKTDPDGKSVERRTMPGGHNFPETGTRYRLAGR